VPKESCTTAVSPEAAAEEEEEEEEEEAGRNASRRPGPYGVISVGTAERSA